MANLGGWECVAVGCTPDARFVLAAMPDRLGIWNLAKREYRESRVVWNDTAYLSVLADGRWHGPAHIEDRFLFIVQAEDGTQSTLTPAEFKQRYGKCTELDRMKAQALPPEKLAAPVKPQMQNMQNMQRQVSPAPVNVPPAAQQIQN